MALVLAIDQGTTATTALLVSEKGVDARASTRTPLHHPQPGWAESDPREILKGTLEAVRQLVRPGLAAVGITNQRETVLAWDPATGEPLTVAISWQCRRTAAVTDRLRSEGHEDKVRRKTGLPIDPYFSATKIRWLIEQTPGLERRMERGEAYVGTIDAFLAWNLTGEHVTDPSNASRTMLYDIHCGEWDRELLGLFGVPAEALPRVVPSRGIVGECRGHGLDGVPLAGIAGDQQASLYGHGARSPGLGKGTLGTGAFFLVNTGPKPPDAARGVLATVAWDLGKGRTFAAEGAAFSCGAALEWATRMGLLPAPEDLDAAAGPDAGGAVFVPALQGLAAPEWDPRARAALLGLSSHTTPSHTARAIAEGLAAQNARLLLALAGSGAGLERVSLDGGVSRSALVCQLTADFAGRSVSRTTEADVTGLGAAALAGEAVGAWEDGPSAGVAETYGPRRASLDAYERAVEAVRRHARVD